MSRLHQRSFYVEAVYLVEHRLDETLNSILGRAVGPQARYAKGSSGRGEDEVAAGVLGAKVRERELDDVESAEEVGIELVTEVVVILIFARADYAWGGFSLHVEMGSDGSNIP